MLFKDVIIEKHIDRPIEIPSFFIKGKIQIDCEYFIDKIKKECLENTKYNYQTNIKGLRTGWNFFNHDKNFIIALTELSQYLDDNVKVSPCSLIESWGMELRQFDNTLFHIHKVDWSGVIYLNSCNQELIFPQIKQKVKPEPGTFALFSGFLKHGCYRKMDEGSKFGISFNMNNQ
jgi:hypothetical protein